MSPIELSNLGDSTAINLFISKRADFSVAKPYSHWLSADETSKMNRFLFEKDSQQYLVSHCLVRWALSLYSGLLPKDLHFKNSDHGKPYLISDNTLSFNLSHSNEWAVVAIAKERDLGVDIERVDQKHLQKNNSLSSIAKRFFHASEYQHLQTLSGQQKINYFSQLWTLKEAYLKAKGIGLYQDPSTFTFAQRGEVILPAGKDVNDACDNWHCFSFDNIPDYMLSLAISTTAGIDEKKPAINAYRVIPGKGIINEIPLSSLYL